MSWQCLKPIVAYSLGQFDGKHKLRFQSSYQVFNIQSLKEKYGYDNVFLLPCGQCESCRRNYAETWSIRCVLEAHYHPFCYFLTLTYDDTHLAVASKKDFDKFLDRLEGKNHVNKFKYFACMEYGETTNRLHYHVVLFCDFEIDLYDSTKIGDYYYYHSKLIDKFWDFGLYNIAPFESSCARYVAKYTNKLDNKIFMSRNLGKRYVVEHAWEIVKDDFQVYGDFGGRFRVMLPPSLLRWLPPSLSLKGLSFVKTLGSICNSEKIKQYGFPYEESVILNAREKAISVKKKERRL